MRVAAPLIAVLDVGKTNAKVALVDPALGQEIWSARRANAVVQGAVMRELDVVAIEAWLLETLRDAPHRERIAAIVPIAHGAAAVLVDHAGEVLAAPDYEDTCFEEVSEEYAALRDPFAMTYSPSLPQGLNLGRQLFFLQQPASRAVRARGAHSAVSAVLVVAAVGPAGDRGHLARHAHRPVASVRTGLYRRWRASRAGRASCRRCTAPPISSGTLRASVAAATGLPESCMVACGIHDSNASYLRFLLDREREAFTVVSSGTWTIVMANRGELRRLREERDMLANVNVFGAPIATARYMGGREYEAIAQGLGRAHHRRADRGAHQRRDGAAFVRQRRAVFRQARAASMATEDLSGPQRAALATLYSALMTAQLIESLGTAGEIFIDGPLARNPLFGGLLGACVPVGTVRAYPEGGGTRVAAHLAGLPSPQQGALRNVAPLRIAGLLEYQAQLASSSRGAFMSIAPAAAACCGAGVAAPPPPPASRSPSTWMRASAARR